MLRAIMRKGIADLRTRRLQTAILIGIIAMAAATATMALSVQRTAAVPFERLLNEANGAHLWVFDASEEAQSALAEHPGVESMSGPFPRTSGAYATGEQTHALTFWSVSTPLPEVSPAHVIEGRWLDGSGEHEVVIDPGLAKEAGVAVGDRVVFATDVGPTEFEVVGIAAATSRLPYPIWDPAAVYVSPATFAAISPADNSYSSLLGVRLVDPEGAFAVMRDVNEGHEEPLIGGISRWQEIQRSMRENARLTVVVLSTFSAFALVAVGLIVANVVSGQALSQRREIGLLKAVGFTPRDATVLFAGQQLVMGIAGVAMGLVVGTVSAPYWLRDIADQLGQPAARSVVAADLGLVAAGTLLLLLLFTLMPAWRAGRLSTIEALRRSERPDHSASRTHALASRLPLPRAAVTGLKDLFTRPVRTTLTIGAMAMAAATVMFTLTVDATVDGLVEDPAIVGDGMYHLRVDRLTARFSDPTQPEPETALSETAARALVDVDGVLGVVQARQFGIRIGTGGYWARTVEGDLEALHTRFTAGGWPGSADEIVVGYGLAKRLDIGVGDRLTIGANQQETSVAVSGVYVEGSNSGRMLMMLPETAERLFASVPYAELWLVLDDEMDPGSLMAEVRLAVGGRMGVTDERAAVQREIAEAGDTLRSVLYPLNVVLLAIAVANLLTALLFTVRERHRDYALLKAIGFTPGQVLTAVSSGAMVVAILGALVGVPLGYVVTSGLVDYFGGEDGWPTGVAAMPSMLWGLGLVVLAMIVAVIGSWVPARHAAAMGVSEALRYE